MTDSSSGPLPTDPPSIDRRHELLSAMVDGELSADELVELEQLAVDEGTTLEAMAGDYQHIHDVLSGSVLLFQAPPELRVQHLGIALDAAGEPEVASLAAARANRFADRPAGGNRQGRWLRGIAAGLVVVAGIGFATTLGGGGDDSEQAGTAAQIDDATQPQSRTEPTTSSSAASEELRAESSDDGSAEDAIDADEASNFASGAAPIPTVVEGVAPAELASVVEFEQARGQDQGATIEGEVTTDLTCVSEASSLGTLDGFAVVQLEGKVYEVFRTDTGRTAVFEKSDCARVD